MIYRIVDELTPETVIPAMEENFVAWWAYFARAPQAQFHDGEEIAWLHSGIPVSEYNGAVRTRLRMERSADDVAGIVETTRRACALPGVGMSWYLTPSTQPVDLGDHLLRHGFVLSGMAPGMAVDLAAEHSGASHPTALPIEIVRVSDATLVRQWVDVAVASFQEPELTRQARYAVQSALGWESTGPLQRYLALLDCEPVATSALFLSGGVAGIYEVVTIPRYRRQGLGTAMTLATMKAAVNHSYRVGVLQASPMGEPVYRQLGFSRFCQYHLYAVNAG